MTIKNIKKKKRNPHAHAIHTSMTEDYNEIQFECNPPLSIPNFQPPPPIGYTPELRKADLCAALARCGLHYDPSNDACQQYITLGEDALYISVAEIVRLLAEERFLLYHCAYEDGMQLALQQSSGVRLPRDQWLHRRRQCILIKSGYKDFPERWPWPPYASAVKPQVVPYGPGGPSSHPIPIPKRPGYQKPLTRHSVWNPRWQRAGSRWRRSDQANPGGSWRRQTPVAAALPETKALNLSSTESSQASFEVHGA
jgi:hypothetical protein